MIDLKASEDGVLIPVIAQPGAKRNEIVKAHAGAVKIAVQAPPDKGRANEAILELLSETLDMPLRSFELVAGATSRKKMVLVREGDLEAIRDALQHAMTK